MNKYINSPRLALVIRKYWFENRKAIILMALALVSILVIWMSLFLSFRNPSIFREKSQVWNYFMFVLLAACLTGSFLFSSLNSKSKGINYLLLPASIAEKLICVFLFGVVGFWIGYTAVFYAVNYTMVHIANDLYGTHWPVMNIFEIDKYENPFFNHACSIMFYEVFIAQAVCVTGSLYFRQYSFFKTAIVMLVIWVVIVSVFMTSPMVLPTGGFYDSPLEFEVLDYSGNLLVTLPTWFRILVILFFSFGITGWLWMISYLRLKERQLA
jgi:hypothetical protein